MALLPAKCLIQTSKWFGVTYPEDRQSVVDKIQALVDAGEYPGEAVLSLLTKGTYPLGLIL